MSDCIGVDFLGDRQLLEYLGTDGRVIFNTTALEVAGANVSLLYIACLQLLLWICRSVRRTELEK